MTLSGPLSPDLETTIAMVEVAQGKRPADTYIYGGDVVNVYSGEVLPQNIAVHRGRIAYVGAQRSMVGPDTRTIDASGFVLTPGYVNAHDHSDVLTTPTTHSAEALRRGSTTIFYNGRHIPFLVGPEEYRQIIDQLSALPVKLFFGIETGKGGYRLTQDTGEDYEAVRYLLTSPRIFGLHEVVRWAEVIGGDRSLLQKLTLVLQHGKTVEGHTAGASYDKLNALVAAGFQTCHESISLQEVLNRLRLGLYAMLRCSSIRPHDLPDMLRAITESGVSSSRLILVPDGMIPSDSIEKGNMDFVVASALDAGVEPVTAYQMATLNPATHFGMDGEIGGIAPRRWADILFLRDLREPTPVRVMSSGEMVVEDGRLTVDFPEPDYYRLIHTKFAMVKRPPELDPATFEVPGEEGKPFPVIEMVSSVINRRLDLVIPVENGVLKSDPQADILYVALVAGSAGRTTRGLIKGFGAAIGGMAVTADGSSEMVVIGHDPAQMSAAARRVWELQGGIVIHDGGRRIFELPLPIGGVMSPEPLPLLAARTSEAARILKQKGFPFDDMHYTIGTLTWYFLPQLRLTAEGILDVKQGMIVVPSAPLS
ncbi:MAG: adenine deaminase C-terminal domain-containing protein [Dehalococcoidia bacterium]|nr:adenine deaminase C-terminal domain-containing protein [Dehalococcoidia bacterium]